MKLPASKIELAASREPSRYTLQAVKLDVENKRFLATDGHILAMIPAEVEPEDVSALIGLDTIKTMRTIAKQDKPAAPQIRTNGAIICQSLSGRMEFPIPTGSFPNADAVLLKPEGPATITLDVSLLMRLAQALNEDATAKRAVVSLWIKDPQSAIAVRSGSGKGHGVLMPCRP